MKKLEDLFLAGLIGALFLGCSKSSPTTTTITKHDTTYVAPAKVVYATIGLGNSAYPPYQYFDEYVDVFADPTPNLAQSSAQIKYANSLFQLTFEKRQDIGWIGLHDTIHIPYPGIPCSLFVNTNLGISTSGGVSFPGAFAMNAPRQNDTLPWGDVVFSWTQAQYATWYDLDVNYMAYNGQNLLGTDDTLLFLTGTSALISQGYFRKYGSATYLNVVASVNAHNGAMAGPGQNGNMAGDIKGFFYSSFSDTATSRWFYMGSPKLVQNTPLPSIDARKRKQAILRAFDVRIEKGNE